MSTRIVVDALSARLGGGLSYLTQQLAALERVAPDLEVRVIAAPANAASIRATIAAPVTVVRGGSMRPLFEQTVLPLLGSRREVLYCPGNFAPLAPARRATVLTIQNPNYFGSGRRAHHNRSIDRRVRSRLARWSASRADEVIVISEALLEEVRADLPDVARRATLIPSGAPVWPAASAAPPSLPHDVGDYFLSLANDAPHKQLDHTVAAWNAAFAETDRSSGTVVPALVMAGRFFDTERPAAQRALVNATLRDRFIQIGGITDRGQVRWLLEHAHALVSSASLEAHPLTPAEAGSLGCPLILSDIPAHREVAGDHATFVAVGALPELVDALRSAASSTITPTRSPWAWPVSWDDNAERLAAVFERAGRA